MSDPKAPSGNQPRKSVGPEEGGHRVTSPSAADGKRDAGKAPEPPEDAETSDALDAVPSDVEPETR